MNATLAARRREEQAGKPRSRYEVRYVTPEGSIQRWTSRKTGPFDVADLIVALRDIADELERENHL